MKKAKSGQCWRTRIPQFEAIKLRNSWAGHYSFNTFDQNAIVGPHSRVENFIFVNGFSGHGFQQSPAMGRGVSELLVHGAFRTLDLTPFGYDRIEKGEKFPEKGRDMKLPVNPFVRGLAAGEKQLGLWVSLSNNYAAEAVASAGFNWLLVDMEHSPGDLQTVLGQLQAIAAHGSTAIVRPPWNEPVIIKRLLDMGAPGLLFPMVQTVVEAKAAVAATRYPPQGGVRGVAGTTRANNFGRITEYYDRVDAETAVLIQLESLAALENAVEIGTVDGVTGVFFGPADIGADMGLLGNPMDPAIWDKIRPAAQKLIAAGVPVGTLVSDAGFAAELMNDGFSFVACGSDAGLLARGADALLARVRNGLE